ncbi:hypothetical protein C1646_524330 [Rhizophagus diaphanus]|nr:hypothetical protein C1646_524330 [Rhizophagus diaphanus] [Rhizophagus sp. MUCL 43196]
MHQMHQMHQMLDNFFFFISTMTFDNSEEQLQLDEQDLSIFEEPEGYLPPQPKPTFQTFSRKDEHLLQ